MSKSFNLDSVLKSFMESARKETFDNLGSDANEVRFQNYIRGKKFFLVLDGVWQENRSDWSSFFELLEVQSNGCAVLVTTQSVTGAAVVGSKHTYELSTLLEEDLMAIFEANAFKLSQERSSDYPDLMEIGKEIVSSCYGNPMFVKTFGEVLFDKRTKKEWQLVQDTNISELPRNESSISEALSLCYYRLPTHLKACLSYCALFSKSFEFEKDFLTKLWLAGDLIQSKVNIRIEDSADLCFEELVKRSYFQISVQQQGTTQKYKLQGLVYEMFKIVGTNNPFKARVDSRRSLLQQSKYLRYLSLDYHDGAEAVDMNDLVAFKKLRTIILMRQVPFAGFCDDFFEKLEFIRVLDLSRSGITALPSSIKDCKYLKYLDVSGSEIASIDAGICNLIWLETLKIKNCKHLKELPEEFSNLVNIRHLEMDEESLVHTPVHIRRLTQLRELKKFVIRNLNGCRIAELVEMNQLEGSLCIEGVEHASDVEEDEAQPERYLDRKDHVQKLKLYVKDQAVPIGTAKLGFELSHPSPKLPELIVEGYIWDSLWEWDWRSLALETVDLIGCSNLTSIRGLRELPRLKRLKLSGFNVIYLDSSFFGQDDDVGFSLLDTLALDLWNQWETWDGVGKYMLKIVRLCIQNCPAFHTLPDLSEWHSLNFLDLKSCNSLQNCLGSPPPDIHFPTVEKIVLL
ncbi:putative disease resistance protein RGA3 [Papaver somniferum]|uniref:putative disease resistance protein RGA3 n=1 Tax=Papaver somniferum TaxID=3469 RepID=UPI000E6F6B7D|nr:putative disease resistance protein RGA3 [Papaver somniferum]XP_026413685.1 putative disease resistance protein RGA3 [Papaver somniferum]